MAFYSGRYTRGLAKGCIHAITKWQAKLNSLKTFILVVESRFSPTLFLGTKIKSMVLGSQDSKHLLEREHWGCSKDKAAKQEDERSVGQRSQNFKWELKNICQTPRDPRTWQMSPEDRTHCLHVYSQPLSGLASLAVTDTGLPKNHHTI